MIQRACETTTLREKGEPLSGKAETDVQYVLGDLHVG